jgi:hypothetical protein
MLTSCTTDAGDVAELPQAAPAPEPVRAPADARARQPAPVTEPEPEATRQPFPAVGDGLWVRSRGFPRWPAVLVPADRYEPEEQKALAKHPHYAVVNYFGTGQRMAVDPKVGGHLAARPTPRWALVFH